MRSFKLNSGNNGIWNEGSGVTLLDVFLNTGFGVAIFLASAVFDDGFSCFNTFVFAVITLFLFWGWSQLSSYSSLSNRPSAVDWLAHAIAIFSMMMLASSAEYAVRGDASFSSFWILLTLVVLLFLWRRLAAVKHKHSLANKVRFMGYWLGFMLIFASLFVEGFVKYVFWLSAIGMLTLLPLSVWVYAGTLNEGKSGVVLQRHRLMVTILLAVCAASVSKVFPTVYYADEIALAFAAFLLLVALWRVFMTGLANGEEAILKNPRSEVAYYLLYLPLLLFLIGIKGGLSVFLSNSTEAIVRTYPFSLLLQSGAGLLVSALGILTLIFSGRQKVLIGAIQVVAGIAIVASLAFDHPHRFDMSIYKALTIVLFVVLAEWVVVCIQERKGKCRYC